MVFNRKFVSIETAFETFTPEELTRLSKDVEAIVTHPPAFKPLNSYDPFEPMRMHIYVTRDHGSLLQYGVTIRAKVVLDNHILAQMAYNSTPCHPLHAQLNCVPERVK